MHLKEEKGSECFEFQISSLNSFSQTQRINDLEFNALSSAGIHYYSKRLGNN